MEAITFFTSVMCIIAIAMCVTLEVNQVVRIAGTLICAIVLWVSGLSDGFIQRQKTIDQLGQGTHVIHTTYYTANGDTTSVKYTIIEKK